MKTLAICGVLTLLSIVACSRISDAGEPGSGTPASPAIVAPPLTLGEYVYLHETRNTGDTHQVAARASLCLQ